MKNFAVVFHFRDDDFVIKGWWFIRKWNRPIPRVGERVIFAALSTWLNKGDKKEVGGDEDSDWLDEFDIKAFQDPPEYVLGTLTNSSLLVKEIEWDRDAIKITLLRDWNLSEKEKYQAKKAWLTKRKPVGSKESKIIDEKVKVWEEACKKANSSQ